MRGRGQLSGDLVHALSAVRFVPWGYYGLLALVRMDWNEATRVTRFFWKWPAPTDLVLLCLWAALFLLVGRALFVRKEV